MRKRKAAATARSMKTDETGSLDARAIEILLSDPRLRMSVSPA
jgi:hypothetical protein